MVKFSVYLNRRVFVMNDRKVSFMKGLRRREAEVRTQLLFMIDMPEFYLNSSFKNNVKLFFRRNKF